MRSVNFKSVLIKSGLVASVLLLAAGTAFAQSVVNLTATPQTAALPDGTNVPMWGYNCGAASNSAVATATATIDTTTGQVASLTLTSGGAAYTSAPTVNFTGGGGTGASFTANIDTTTGSPTFGRVISFTPVSGGSGYTSSPVVTLSGGSAQAALAAPACTAANGAAQVGGTTWQPPLITVPAGASLTINLTNNLSFQPPTPTGGTAPPPNTVPTSLAIVGQLGGGLGDVTQRTTTPPPDHTKAQPLTWPIAGNAPGAPVTGVGTPPVQGPRVQSFSTEVAAGATTALTWNNLKPGTYLIESGTHPSIQGPMGLYGILVVTTAPANGTAGTAYPAVGTTAAVMYNADIPLLLSEIDPVQNNAVSAAVQTAGFAETNVWSGLYGGCGNPLNANGTRNSGTTAGLTPLGTCYPPAVNYTPLYYLINGRAFDKTKTNPSASLFAATAGTAGTPPAPVTTGITGTVLVRLVNAGLRMHVPSIVGAQTGTTTPAPSGFALIAEDGNVLPGVPRVQSEVFMPAGKTTDVMINVPATGATALPIFDRQLSLSANSIARDAGMLAYISINGAPLPSTGAFSTASTAAVANPDTYNSVIAGQTLTVSDPFKGVIANDVNISGVQVVSTAPAGLTLNPDGTFTYIGGTPTSFMYCGNGQTSGPACTTVTLGAAPLEAAGGIMMNPITYNANGTFLKIQPPGILSVDKDGAGYPLMVAMSAGNAPVASSGLTLSVDPNGGFNASVSVAGTYTFTYRAQNSQGTVSAASATVTLVFPTATGLGVTVLDGKDVLAARQNAAICATVPSTPGCVTPTTITDYRWIIEEDRTFFVDPSCTANPPPAGCPTAASGIVPTLGTNFHTSYMPVVATGCTGPLSCEGGQTIFDPTTGTHVNAVCDVGNGVCRPDTSSSTLGAGSGFAQHLPREVHLDPTKRYYLTVFPGDAGNPFANANLSADCTNGVAAASNRVACGHGMGGAPLRATCTPQPCAPTTFPAVTVLTQPDPYPPSKLSVFVFQDDFPLNGEHDGGGGIDVLATNEPGLGGFNITLFDDAGGTGDATGQMTYDMFNQPLVNSLAGTIDPATGLDACPVAQNPRIGMVPTDPTQPVSSTNPLIYDQTQTGITGTIVTCPRYESDGVTLSALAGQAVIANLMPGRYGVVATPGADVIARGEEWLQTNTLDGQKAHDSFLRIGEPSYFQEFGPAGYHVSIGFANPKIIQDRLAGVCNGTNLNLTGTNCTNTLTGVVTDERMSRTPDERLYSSGDNSSFAFTQCYVSFGDPDGEDFAFTKCNADGTFTLSGLPDGEWRITVFDQWNDMLVDGLSTPVRLGAAGAANFCPGSGSTQHSCNMGDIAMNQWQANIYTTTFFDANGNGVRDPNETGLTLVATNIRFRDGSYSTFNNTDLSGNAGFNEVFPLFSWYVIETDSSRYKNTGTHVVYDAGGPADGSPSCGAGGTLPCLNSTIASMMANTAEQVSVPVALRVPGAVYCAGADCTGHSIAGGPGSSDPPSACTTSPSTGATTCSTLLSTGRIDPPWVWSEGWQGFSGQNSFIEFGKAPFAAGENGGIHGEVIYASTRPFDDPQLLLHTSWTPDVPGVTINLYQVGTAPDGSQSLTLVDTTKTSSWDDWAQGFYPSTNKPYMNCPGQLAAPTTTAAGDLFFFTLYNQPMYLDFYNSQHGGPTPTALTNNSQFKCYDGMHNWNQVQPAPYDGMYRLPSVTTRDPTTGRPVAPALAISSISEAQTTVTVSTATPHGLSSGAIVIIAGAPAGYNGTFTVTVTGASSFTYTLATTGLAAGTGGTATALATNCTACVVNPTDGTPMLPRGQYVVEMIVPPGYELVKEEDKNILIGDNYIAPVTVQFPGLGSAIYILPDQASVAAVYNANQRSLSAFNGTNAQNPTQAFGRISSLPSHEGDTGSVEAFWPCAGATRIVPDYISLFPNSHEVAPFAGAKRNLCDRKLVTLDDQTSALAKFWVFTSAHVAAHFTGVITDDFTSEFDPFSPQFGEKFSPANLPVAIKDWTGQEISRVYADQWGTYDGLTYSTWEVNPPNPTGYAPTMMVTCMNDPGTGATPDPLFNPAYSQFCYEIPFMPGQTQYMDTPVVPTSAFAGAGYNNPDCDYPDATPAISEVDGGTPTAVQRGPWVSAPGVTLHIYALGTVPVNNYGYSGPSATTAPFNAKTVTRKYSFGTTAGTVALVGSDGVARPLTGVSWGDLAITGTVPTGLPNCPVQQQAQYGGSTAQCGELVITVANGKRSVDTVTVTIGGKAPIHVTTSNPLTQNGPGSLQSAIDAAAPGDLIIVDPATPATSTSAAVPSVHNEILLMWKPVRLQGVGAASSIVNANTHPAGKLDPWRAQVNCLFGLALNGQPLNSGAPITFPPAPTGTIPPIKTNPYDPTGARTCPAAGWANFTGTANNSQVDRLPLEATIGWDTSLNGNLAELLQEPSLMGAYEGAGITVVAKGVRFPPGVNTFGIGSDSGAGSSVAHEGQFPVPTVELTSGDCTTSATNPTNPFPSNFQCNPSSIDGLSITNSSQGGGGIFLHGWAHNLEIANNRVYNNTGTLTGGISIGQGESPDALLANNGGNPLGYNGGTLAGFDQQPWTCLPGAVVKTTATPFGWDQVVNPPGTVPDQQLPFCFNLKVNVHNNAVTKNSSIGDELFSSTPAGAGGVTFSTGADYYEFKHNWVCGNLSTGDGGGVSQLGFSWNGHIEHNSILFNQSTNPTVPTNGGGIVVMSTGPDGFNAAALECGSVTDVDCAPGLGDGTGPGLVINANLIMGNAAESGSGGGIRFQGVNGTEVSRFPSAPSNWYSVSMTNNIIANNLAGWDGAGVSLQDALVVNLINNTIVSNDTTASSGVLFNTLGAPLASSTGPTCTVGCGTTSAPQPAGLVAIQNSSNLTAALNALPAATPVICPAGHYAGTAATNGTCRNFSYPYLANDVFWENRSFYIGVGSLGTGPQNQQNVVALYNAFAGTPAATQPTTDATAANGGGVIITGGTGACVTPNAAPNYWDIGVRGDTGPANHNSGVTLAPTYSVLTSVAGYTGLNNTPGNPTFIRQYCNGSRVPPEFKSLGYQVPAGISDATVPNPIFNLTPAATVDEGNNWINISWGPLSTTNPTAIGTNGYGSGNPLGNYGPTAGSSVINYIPSSSPTYGPAPSIDFYGALRKTNGFVDAGAVEFAGGGAVAGASVTGGPLAFGNVLVGTTSATRTLTLHNTGTAAFVGINLDFSSTLYSRSGGTCVIGGNLGPGATCTINVVFSPTAVGAVSATLSIAGSVNVTGSPVMLTGTGVAQIISAALTPATWSATANRGVTLTGPAQAFTLTNTGNVPLTGIAQGALVGPNQADWTIIRLLSTCGPAGGGQLLGQTTLAVGASCLITVQFRPLVTEPLNSLSATLSVTDAAGTQTAALTGTATGAGLISISPTSGVRGTTVPVTLTGTNLTVATAVNAGTGITCAITGTTTATTLTASCVIATGTTATLGAHNVTVSTPTGTSNAATFTVLGPTLTSIAPTSGSRTGTNPHPVTLTGTNLTGATAVSVSGTLVTCAITGTPTATTVTANCSISSTAATGNRAVSVTTPIGTTNTVTFVVN